MINKGKLFKFFSFIFLMTGMVLSIFVISSNKIEAKAAETEVSDLDGLQNALSTANENTTIIVKNRININSNIELNGKGATVTVPSPFINEDGTLNADIDYGYIDNVSCSKYVVFNISNAEVTISNMTIMGGYPEDDYENDLFYSEYERAAVSVDNAYLKLTNVTLTRSYRGLGLNSGAKVEMHNCNVVRNAAEYGGGIYSNDNGTLLMDGCSLSENRSLSDGGGGGAIENHGLFIANNTVIVNNYSTECGGAINGLGDMYLINCTVTGNASETDCPGAGISVRQGEFYAVNSIITDNYRKNGTLFREDIAVYYVYEYNIKLINCIYGAITDEESINLVKTNCYVDTEYKTATSYRYSGVLNSIGGYTDPFYHPAAITKTSGKPELYVPTNGNYEPVRTGGIKTYFNYSYFKDYGSVGIGYGDTSTALIGFVSESDQVTSYYESDTRVDGVIGASASTEGDLYTVTLTANSDGVVSGATIYGDSYLSGTKVTV
ncbi:MAG: hypothetical protein K6E87_00975, partial [bacterium]|nr:hypothetical protein [bacterium]